MFERSLKSTQGTSDFDDSSFNIDGDYVRYVYFLRGHDILLWSKFIS